ncbi:hypothetical protein NIES4074_52640 [Cylindrospermum sp. NIES-4074]|nr:hypothetical protein NIES4074_52640 [Cylindrospermum sp. NIES-4074]
MSVQQNLKALVTKVNYVFYQIIFYTRLSMLRDLVLVIYIKNGLISE